MLGILHLGLDALTCIIELFSIYENRSMHRYFDEHEHFMILIGASLRAARSRRPPLPEILLWTTTSLHPSESQTSECSDLLSRSRATCLIVAQRQPGKLLVYQRLSVRMATSADHDGCERTGKSNSKLPSALAVTCVKLLVVHNLLEELY